MTRQVLGAAALALAAVVGCGGDDPGSVAEEAAGDGEASTTSTTTPTPTRPPVSREGPMQRPESTTTTEAETTTTTEDGTPSVTADPDQCAEAGSDPGNPEPAAQAVFIAWTRGDRGCASRLMTPAAFDELFARDGSGATDTFAGCFESDEGDPHMDCAFVFEGGATHYLMQFSPLEGWKVFDITQFAD